MFHVEQSNVHQPDTWVSSPWWRREPSVRPVASAPRTFIRRSRHLSHVERSNVQSPAHHSTTYPVVVDPMFGSPEVYTRYRRVPSGPWLHGHPDAAQLCCSSPITCRVSNHVAHRVDGPFGRCSGRCAHHSSGSRFHVEHHQPQRPTPTARAGRFRVRCGHCCGRPTAPFRPVTASVAGRRGTERSVPSGRPVAPTGFVPSGRSSGAARTDLATRTPPNVRRPTFQQRTGVVSAGRRSRAPPARESHRATSGVLRPTGRRRAAR